ncbi:hypothetical protein RFI_08951 [Reticulomyxa filosa]|uniref:Uncharacterized protein n=1 Tax=Reticulomyxa filosa TaxID=46433 RepID=X6NQI8_RETFI|nr:hypothetical protein RFI_08951 [Reticulomyxa filosa]|eukprot:ETO28183.1 hypothetical protein RFI_08951 [Reticulomyxa filosa]
MKHPHSHLLTSIEYIILKFFKIVLRIFIQKNMTLTKPVNFNSLDNRQSLKTNETTSYLLREIDINRIDLFCNKENDNPNSFNQEHITTSNDEQISNKIQRRALRRPTKDDKHQEKILLNHETNTTLQQIVSKDMHNNGSNNETAFPQSHEFTTTLIEVKNNSCKETASNMQENESENEKQQNSEGKKNVERSHQNSENLEDAETIQSNKLQTWGNIVKFFADSLLKSSAANGKKWASMKEIYDYLCRHNIELGTLSELGINGTCKECKCLQEMPHVMSKLTNGELWLGVDEEGELEEGNRILDENLRLQMRNEENIPDDVSSPHCMENKRGEVKPAMTLAAKTWNGSLSNMRKRTHQEMISEDLGTREKSSDTLVQVKFFFFFFFCAKEEEKKSTF